MFCPKCGTDVPEGSKFCETCGNNMQLVEKDAQSQPEAEPVLKSEPAASAPQPVQKPQPAYQSSSQAYQPQPQAPAYQPQSQTPMYQPQPQSSGYQSQPQSPGYQHRPQSQPVPAYQNNTYNGGDPREKPYSVGGWLLTFLVMCIPVVNVIMWFVWAFSSNTNKSKKNFFIAFLIMAAIGVVLTIILSASIVGMINGILEEMGGGFNFDY